MCLSFKPGKKYSRTDVKELLGLARNAKGGSWDAGIVENKGEFFIFTNVGTSGTTGHYCGNRWEEGLLRWYHKKTSHINWPSVRRLLDAGRAHVFWRISNQAPFEYAGYARKVKALATSPVEVLWSFDNTTSDTGVLKNPGVIATEGIVTQSREHGFEVGHRVRHPNLGLGRVLAISGQDPGSSATIYFAGSKERRELLLSSVEKVAGFGPV